MIEKKEPKINISCKEKQNKQKTKKKGQIPSISFELARPHVWVAPLSWFLSRKLSVADRRNTKSKSKYRNRFTRSSLRKPAKIYAKHKINENDGVNEQHGFAWWPEPVSGHALLSKLSKFNVIITFEHFFCFFSSIRHLKFLHVSSIWPKINELTCFFINL